jgi:adenosylmethionine-8-amino-7-oxononanoate aminotransferase
MTLVPGQIVPDQQQPDRRQGLTGRRAQPGLPAAHRRSASGSAGSTDAAHTLRCTVGVEALRILREEHLIENADRVGGYLLKRLKGMLGRPLAGDVRGLGLMAGIELVRDKATKEPFPPELRVSQQVLEESLSRGLICYPLTGTGNGVAGDHIKLSPLLILTESQADELITALSDALDAVAARVGQLIAN